MEIWRLNQIVQRPIPLAAVLPPEGEHHSIMEENGNDEDSIVVSKSNAHPVPISYAATNGAIVPVDGHCCNDGGKRSTKSRKLEYMECLKNHAAALGGHILDGCGEFMASPDTNPSEPTSLTCAACGCHRNFHRQRYIGEAEVDDSNNGGNDGPCMLMALSRAGCRPLMDSADPQQPRRKKRFRTRFSCEQKEMMRQLAQRLGWRMPKRDDVMLDESCRAIGVSRSVFKVWMHNNKNSSLNTVATGLNGKDDDVLNGNSVDNGNENANGVSSNHDRSRSGSRSGGGDVDGVSSSSSPSPSPSCSTSPSR